MIITKFKNSAWHSPFWKIKGVINAMIFAWKHPRHVQVSVFKTSEDEFLMQANYCGISERGFLKVMSAIGKDSEKMSETENAFKNILQTLNGE